MSKLIGWSLKARWLLIFLTAILLFFRESLEEPLSWPVYFTHLIEYFIYGVFLLIVGLLMEMLIRANAQQARAYKLLNHKHKLSRDLAIHEDWHELIEQLVQYPAQQAPVAEVLLLIHQPLSDQFELVGAWQKQPGEKSAMSRSEAACQGCIFQRQSFMPCQLQSVSALNSGQPEEYCLPINYGKQMFAFLRLRLEAGARLTPEQQEIFNNIGDEIGVALMAHQIRKNANEMKQVETSLAERRSVSHYLHDNLGQNLAYLCLKLDQWKQVPDLAAYQTEIETLYTAANHSFEIVRGTLETNHPATAPILENLLAEHAHKVSKRAHLEVQIQQQGEPVYVSPEIQRAVFYVFQEVLSNVEKHAQARRVLIQLAWCTEQLFLKISDDGIGFNPQTVDHKKHFGLEIMSERIAKVQGRVELVTTENTGTLVTVTVPLARVAVGG